jgi:hypothetical protein
MAPSLRTVISPSRYVQGKGSIHQLGEYLKPIGSTPLLEPTTSCGDWSGTTSKRR